MSFRDIKGQDSAITALKDSLKHGRVASAYVFAGPRGIGKMMTAVAFAKALNCPAVGGERPCDSCVSCKKIDSRSHPDVFVSGPAREGAPVGIEEIRRLTKAASLKPYEGRKKVFIIDGVSSVTDEAQNALLKTFEEPPQDCVIILAVKKIADLLPTVTSRARTIKFFPLAEEDTAGILMREYKLDQARARVLSRLAAGSIGDALAYNNDSFFNKRARVIRAIADRTFFESDFDSVSKTDFRLYLDVMLSYFRDAMMAKAGFDESAFINIDKKDAILDEARHMKFEDLDDIIKRIALTDLFMESNVNLKLAMSALGLAITAKHHI